MARWKQIYWDGAGSFDDYGLTINEKEIGNPAKKKRRVAIPNGNGYYDYASILGEQYGERQLKYTFNIGDYATLRKDIMNTKKIKALNWLVPGTQRKLFDEAIPGYYFLAEVQDAPTFTEWKGTGTLEVVFTAYPFKISDKYEGDDVWDTFNFELDIAQNTEFNVNGPQTRTIFNQSVTRIAPEIVVTGKVQVTLNGKTVSFDAGTYTRSPISLGLGENTVQLSGTGTIYFKFRKELL
ncbi:phage tail protein [Latilactobacillus curvatus]|uniref:phage tail protein n=1 Tax=Latilactobacillus curvatus TaxID=28038 RepID=UPI00223C07B9|nr:phage tail protein [Latilactobacillus curvatus]MCS8616389.1 phage tail protein [Latilactobacillus curvatus]